MLVVKSVTQQKQQSPDFKNFKFLKHITAIGQTLLVSYKPSTEQHPNFTGIFEVIQNQNHRSHTVYLEGASFKEVLIRVGLSQ